jgi:hypothetical protein
MHISTTEILISKAKAKINFWQSQMDKSDENSKRYEQAKAYRQKYAESVNWMLHNPKFSKQFSFISK